MMSLDAQVRCPTPTVRGVCNRWQFSIEHDHPDGHAFQFRCSHCKITSIVWSSQVTSKAHAHAIRG